MFVYGFAVFGFWEKYKGFGLLWLNGLLCFVWFLEKIQGMDCKQDKP